MNYQSSWPPNKENGIFTLSASYQEEENKKN